MKRSLLFVCLILCAASILASARGEEIQYRLWTVTRMWHGKPTGETWRYEAKLIARLSQCVVLEMEDGRRIVASMSTLSDTDLQTLGVARSSLVLPAQSILGQATGRVASQRTSETRQPATPRATSHWLTIKSGIRHNSSCPYYRNSKGRPCGPNEGRACKKCGG